MTAPRVTILTHPFARVPGGGARTYFEQANGLAERGYDVTVVNSLDRRPGLMKPADILRGKVRDARAGHLRRQMSWMPLDPRITMTCVDRFDDGTRLPPADLRISTYWLTAEYLGNHREAGVRHMQLIQAYETWGGPADRVDATWRLPFPKAVVSESLRRRGLELGVPADQLHVVPNGLDHSIFATTVPIEERGPVVAFLVHPAPVKGLQAAVDTATLVHTSRPDVEWLAFGARARPAELPEFVTYLQHPVGSELAEQVYNRAAVFLCSSLSEGFGFPSIEAMACGAALVSTANGGVDEFAVDGETALIRPVGDVPALADAVLKLIDDPALRMQIATAGRAAVARFDWRTSRALFADVAAAALAR